MFCANFAGEDLVPEQKDEVEEEQEGSAGGQGQSGGGEEQEGKVSTATARSVFNFGKE